VQTEIAAEADSQDGAMNKLPTDVLSGMFETPRGCTHSQHAMLLPKGD
jgi:hypothetical protein